LGIKLIIHKILIIMKSLKKSTMQKNLIYFIIGFSNLKNIIFIVFLIIGLVSCVNSSKEKKISQYEQDLKILHNTYWIIQKTSLENYSDKSQNKKCKVPDNEKTIHFFKKSGIVNVYDNKGHPLNAFSYESVNQNDRLSHLIVKNRNAEDQKYLVMLFEGYLELHEIIVTLNITAIQKHIFVELKDSTLLNAIK